MLGRGRETASAEPPGARPDTGLRTLQLALVGFRKTILAALGVAAVVGLWWLLALETISARVPAPPEVIESIGRNFTSIRALEYVLFTTGGIYQNLLYTIENVLIGVALGTAVGFPLGVLIGRVRIARDLLEPPLLVLGTVPVVMLLPFLTMWFGTARIAQNGLVIFYAALTVAVVAQQATLGIAGRFEQYATSLGAGQGPHSLPGHPPGDRSGGAGGGSGKPRGGVGVRDGGGDPGRSERSRAAHPGLLRRGHDPGYHRGPDLRRGGSRADRRDRGSGRKLDGRWQE